MTHREWAREKQIRFDRLKICRLKTRTPTFARMVAASAVLPMILQFNFSDHRQTSATAFGAISLAANQLIAENQGRYFDDRAAPDRRRRSAPSPSGRSSIAASRSR
jgi:hypothetical protein